MLKKFIIENDIVSFRKDIGFGTTVLRFFQNGGKSCGKNHLSMKTEYGHPFIDHYMFFKTKSGSIIFTSQPYADKNYIINEFKLLFSNDFELEVYDTKDSWYYPGQVCLFTIKLK